MERQQSTSGRSTPHTENPNVFDDEFAIDGSEYGFGLGVADGFGEEHVENDEQGQQSGQSRRSDQPGERSSLRRSFSYNSTATTAAQAQISRNSTSKSHYGRPSVSREGSGRRFPDRTPSTFSAHSPALFHRTSTGSNASFATTARSGSPFPGATGPSHPYAMYPQNIGLARSTSVTTASTTRTPQRTSLSHRPAHPYALYHQNVFEDPEEAPPQPLHPIPVGFPGLSSQFHRRLGPDGEEQDIIGPDGHTEQLPPYSRYPEEGPTKASLAAAEAAEQGMTPPDTSQDTLLPSSRRTSHQIPPTTTLVSSQSETIASNNSQEAAKKWSEKSWKEKRATKVLFGKVRLWVILLAIGIVILIAVVLGAVIGSFLTKEHYNKLAGETTPAAVVTTIVTSATTMWDASVLTATPTGLSPLPTGGFILPLYQPDETQQHCLTNADQLNAWSCQMRGPPLKLEVDVIEAMGSNPFFAVSIETIVPNDQDADDLGFGMLPPTVSNSKLMLVKDLDDPTRGPAFHFQATYDKVVVVSPDHLPPVGYRKVRKRHGPPRGFPGYHRQEFSPGDQFWFCFWNDTFIEGFIYVNNNSSQSVPSFYGSAPTTSGCITTPPASTTEAAESYPDPPPWMTDLSTPSTFPAEPSETAPKAEISEYDRARVRRDNEEDEDDYHSALLSSIPFSNTAPPSYTPSVSEATTTSSYSNSWEQHPDWPSPPPPFPRVIKIEERRLPGIPQKPYCKLMKVGDDYHQEPVVEDGWEITIELEEEDPTTSQFESANAQFPSSTDPARRTPYRMRAKREEPSNSCHCQWVIS